MMIIVFQWIYSQDPPIEFGYSTSTFQAFYFFNEVTLNGASIDSDDWVAAFKGDICVGARQLDTSSCGGGVCDIPVLGDDASEWTAGYMTVGEIPTFKIFDSSLGNIYDAIPSEAVDPWSFNGFSMNDLLEANWSINSADFEYTGSITSEIYINGLSIGSEDDMLAAFVDGEIRGVASGLQSPFDNIVFPIMVYSNNSSGETLKFIFYDSSSNLYVELNETFVFISDMIEGTAVTPIIFTIPSIDIAGCTDFEACNYNGSATTDDDSCIFAEENYDCDGVCILDIDCDGTCGGNLVDDECSVCGGPGEIIWYADTDEDGLGDPNNSTTNCEQPEGYVADDSDSYPDCTTNIVDNCGECNGDNTICIGCEDAVACNTGEDSDCVYASIWYADTDEDGLGDPNNSTPNCEQPEGYVLDDSDSYPDCVTNDTDICGECAGNETDASNCLSIDTQYINDFSINSIYPNPFNPVVNIDLSIHIAGHLQISVFTVEGIQIKIIYNGPSSVGESTFTWTPKNRASGFYFIKVILDDRVETQKALLLK